MRLGRVFSRNEVGDHRSEQLLGDARIHEFKACAAVKIVVCREGRGSIRVALLAFVLILPGPERPSNFSSWRSWGFGVVR